MTEQVQQKGIHFAMWIFAGCCCLGASGMALVSSIKGIYMLPGSQHMGITATQWSLWVVALGLTQIVSFPVWGQLMKKHLRLSLTVAAILEIAAILLFTVVHSVAGVIVIGILLGIAIPMTFLLSIPALITNWFAPKQRGRFLGIAMAFSGVGTFVWAPLFTSFLKTYGYNTTYYINALIFAVLVLPWCFVMKFSPSEIGLKPFGYDPNYSPKTRSEYGMNAVSAMKTPAFILMFLVIGLTAIGMGFMSILPAMSKEMFKGTAMATSAAAIGAWMISMAAIGNMVGKVFFGFLGSLLGLRKTMYFFFFLFIMSFVTWLWLPGSVIPMYVGGFLLGTHNGITGVGNPEITRELFGGMAYEKIYSRLSIASAIVGGFSTTIITALAAKLGSYTQAMYGGIVLVLILAFLATLAMRHMGKLEWDSVPEEDAAVPAARA
ncbi:MAG: MFS transporter [Coriobacteriia bacterium]|nr:MFS transporter [Coriobacteriia bacterium]